MSEAEVQIIVNSCVEQMFRKLESGRTYPEFAEGNVPVAVAARVFGKDASWVRSGIENGWLKIGVCSKVNKRINYYISPKLLWEVTGYVWKGNEAAL